MEIKNKNFGKYGPLIGSIDEGTSSARFMIFSAETGEVVTYHQIQLKSTYPRAEWVEQDPMSILSIVLDCIDQAVKKLEALKVDPKDIVTVGVSNQRETTVLWDKLTGLPYYNAIVWMDNRTCETIDKLLSSQKSRCKNQLRHLCGLPLSPYFSASKYRWLIDNVPEVRKAIEEKRCLFGTVDSWLIWNLTGGTNGGIHITDVTNASRTMLMNINTLRWDEDLLSFFGISADTLPQIRSSSEIYGYLSKSVLKTVPISGCAGDQHAALFGQYCFEEGQTKCTYGTGCFILTNTGSKKIDSKYGLLSTVGYQLGRDAKPVYALEGSVSVAAGTFTWMKENLKLFDDLDEANQLASEVANSRDIYFVPAFHGLYAPYWNAQARGLICGMDMESDRRHLIRAAFEAVSFQTKDILDCLEKDCSKKFQSLKADGGLSNSDFLMQIQADISGIEIVRQEMRESTALGAAILAGVAEGVGVWNFSKNEETYEVFKPKITDIAREKLHEGWKDAIKKCLT